jgi:uncharacterized protein YegL
MKMLPVTKFAVLLWPLILFVVSVESRSFVLTGLESDQQVFKRDVAHSEALPDKNSTTPDIYSFKVTSNIAYRYATTTVSNRVANSADVPKEVSFTVTLPDSAFISGFLMVIKDKVYAAYVKEKEEAKKDYQEAVDRGETAGHVELSARDSNLFTVSVNVEPSSKVTFNLTYEQLLTRTLGLYENVINVNPGQVVKSMDIEVNIDESSDITSLEVPDLKTSNEIDSSNSKTIDVKIERPTPRTAKITWSPSDKQQQQISDAGVKGQLIVRYDVDRVSNPNQILVDEGYFVHFYAPANLKTLNKHVLFALDISGSMAGRKIEQLREALNQILSEIGEGDFFSLILFSDNVQLWTLQGTIGEAAPTWYYDESPSTTTPANLEINDRFIIPAKAENIAKAKAFASTLNETGGTNIIAALRKSVQIAQWGQKTYRIKAKPLIIFLSDGQPNVEMSDTEEIIKTVKKLNDEKYPLFSLAFGEGADYDFLRKLSLSNGGFARNIYVASDTSLQLKNFYKQVASPLLSNVSFAYIPGQIDENSLTKSVFNNLYNGSELVVAGKLSEKSNSVAGNLTGQAFEGYFCVVLPPPEVPVNKTSGHLEKLWAYLYIKELLDKDLISDEKNSTFKQKALNLSLHYGFVTPLTSLVVVKPNDTKPNPGPSSEGQLLTASDPNLRRPAGFGHLAYAPAPIYAMSGVPGIPAAGNTRLGVPQPLNDVMYLSMPLPVDDPLPPSIPYSTTAGPVAPSISGDLAEDALDSTVSTTTLVSPSTLGNMSDIVWLNNRTDIKFPSSNNSYSIFSGDAPNMEFQSCIVPFSNNTVSHCRHLAHCVISEIVKSFDDFVPYGESCVIDARFVGICCPPKYQHQKLENTTLPQDATSTTATATTLTTTA